MATEKIAINRAPVLTLWAAVVAERLGYDRDAALTLGQAVAGVNARSKGRRLGIIDESTDHEQTREERARKPAQPSVVPLLGREVLVTTTAQGVRATGDAQPIDPRGVTRYLQQRFGAALPGVRAAMATLAKAYPPERLAAQAYALYEQFRPAIPEGKRGWGAAATGSGPDPRTRPIDSGGARRFPVGVGETWVQTTNSLWSNVCLQPAACALCHVRAGNARASVNVCVGGGDDDAAWRRSGPIGLAFRPRPALAFAGAAARPGAEALASPCTREGGEGGAEALQRHGRPRQRPATFGRCVTTPQGLSLMSRAIRACDGVSACGPLASPCQPGSCHAASSPRVPASHRSG